MNPPGFKPRADDGRPRRVPDSAASDTVTQLRDLFAAPVWHPEDHPPLPPVVAHGRKPAVFACGVCHRADGPGGPENANIARRMQRPFHHGLLDSPWANASTRFEQS